MSTNLFEVPILATPKSDKAQGLIICSSPAPLVYLLTFTSPPDNRLTTSFCQALLLALDIVEQEYPVGVLITTSGIPKFYSNGLDLEHAWYTEGFFPNSMYAVFKRLLSYPMPTIALVNGHAFAGGLMLAMYHDYRVFNPSRGFLCLNEIDFGVPLRPAMSSIFRQKVANPAVYRSLVLEAKRFGAKDALEGGIVDLLGGFEELLGFVAERKLTEKGKSGVYGLMKIEMFRETLGYVEPEAFDGQESKAVKQLEKDEKRKEVMESRVKEWKRNASGTAKL